VRMGQRIAYAVDRRRPFDACETVKGGPWRLRCAVPLSAAIASVSRALFLVDDWSCW